jgi:hypothetical protein
MRCIYMYAMMLMMMEEEVKEEQRCRISKLGKERRELR